jgi:hypothetical protein
VQDLHGRPRTRWAGGQAAGGARLGRVASQRIVLEVQPGRLAEALTARAAGALAARCDLPVDRLEDAVLVLGCLLSGRPLDGLLRVELEPVADALSIRCGPYAAGEADRLQAVCGPDDRPVLATLAGGVALGVLREGETGDFLELVVAPLRPQSNRLL